MNITKNNTAASAGFNLLTVEEARSHLRISRDGMYQLINSRSLPSLKLGRRRFITRSDLEQLIERLRTEATHGR